MKIWACEANYLRDYLNKKENLSAEEINLLNGYVFDETENRILSFEDGVARIEISGPLTKNKPDVFAIKYGYGGTGYDEIIEAIKTISKDESIKEVRLIINSPGGRVLGVDETYQAIKNLSAKKNVVAVNVGMMASAAYWIGSAARKIYSTSPVNETGSIGVVVAGTDWTEFDKKLGIKEVKVISSNAPNKQANIDSAEGIKELQREIDSIERVFIKRVAEGRNLSIDIVKQKFGQGGMLIAEDPEADDAVSVGMIDGLISPEQINTLGVEDFDSDVSKNSQLKPADAEKTEEVITMSLKKLRSENPAIDAEVKELIAEAKEAGLKEGKESVQKVIKKSVAVFQGEYPKSLQNLAIKVLNGEEEPAALTGAMAIIEAQEEQKKSDSAKLESGNDTPAENDDPKVKGVATTVEDVAALAKLDRGEV